jgi:phage replication-related protein YjqB (UPF0714/DUF867 family)
MKKLVPACLIAIAAPTGCLVADPLSEAVGEAPAAASTTAVLRLDNAMNGTNGHVNERCDVDLAWLNAQLGTSLVSGRQIRIGRTGVDGGGATGACTVQDRPDAGSVVRMGDVGFGRIDMDAPADETTDTAVFLESIVASTAYTIANASTAKTAQEYFEDLKETGSSNAVMVALAPHGGSIELRTDGQANNHFYGQFTAGTVTSWQANGYNNSTSDDYNAFDHWHITSTDIDEGSYPKLAQIANRQFRYAVAFHGYSSTRNGAPFHPSEVIVGGLEAELFRREVAEMINWGVRNDNLTQPITAIYTNLPSDLDGDATDNIVNRITASGKGLQLEQSAEARGVVGGTTDYSAKIAKAVAGVFRCMIDSPAVTVPAQNVASSQDSSGGGYNTTACGRRVVDVTVPSNAGASFRLEGLVPLAGLTQAQCGAFEGYVSIFKNENGRLERKQGGLLAASWNGSTCVASGTYTFDVAPPASGTDTYRVTVSGRHGATLAGMTTLSATARVTRLP